MKKIRFIVLVVLCVCCISLIGCNSTKEKDEITFTKVDAVDATFVSDGNAEYYKGSDGKFYSDAQGKNTISENSWIINKYNKADFEATQYFDASSHYAKEYTNKTDTNKKLTFSGIELYTLSDLNQFATDINANYDIGSDYITLMNDIDLGDTEWTPIGKANVSCFKDKTFDGNGKKISSFNYNGQEKYHCLFGRIENSTVKNITVEGKVTSVNVAGIIGQIMNTATVENCVNNVELEGSSKIAGIVCYIEGNGEEDSYVTIKNCTNNANLKSVGISTAISGIVAYIQGNVQLTIKETKNCGELDASSGCKCIGAMVGETLACVDYVKCSNTGTLIRGTAVGDDLEGYNPKTPEEVL